MKKRIIVLVFLAALVIFQSAAASGNLLINGTFNQPDGCGLNECFEAWNFVNGYWESKRSTGTPSPYGTAAEMDRDRQSDGTTCCWPVGEHDWLWQDVRATERHRQIVFSITEAHHMTEAGLAEITIYGSNDGETWTEVWFRPFPDATHKKDLSPDESVWSSFSYTIPASYRSYRLELHGAIIDPRDGWKFTNLSLHTE